MVREEESEMGTPYILDLSCGQMTYDHDGDRWILTSNEHTRAFPWINANRFKTIREFKVWGEAELQRPAPPAPWEDPQ